MNNYESVQNRRFCALAIFQPARTVTDSCMARNIELIANYNKNQITYPVYYGNSFHCTHQKHLAKNTLPKVLDASKLWPTISPILRRDCDGRSRQTAPKLGPSPPGDGGAQSGEVRGRAGCEAQLKDSCTFIKNYILHAMKS